MTVDRPLQVGMVEDHRLFLDLLSGSLNQLPDIQVVVTAERVTEVRNRFDPGVLDVVVLDIELPDGNGVGLALSLRRANPNIGIVLLSGRNMLDLVTTLPPADRRGWCYLSKASTRSVAAIAGVIRSAARGVSVFDPALSERSSAQADTNVSRLTARQYEVLRAVADGLSNQAIADRLGIAANTVGNHLIGIYSALGIPEGKNARVAAVLEFLNEEGQHASGSATEIL